MLQLIWAVHEVLEQIHREIKAQWDFYKSRELNWCQDGQYLSFSLYFSCSHPFYWKAETVTYATGKSFVEPTRAEPQKERAVYLRL